MVITEYIVYATFAIAFLVALRLCLRLALKFLFWRLSSRGSNEPYLDYHGTSHHSAVLIVGFAGSSPKHLCAISKLYQKWDFDVICFIPSWLQFFDLETPKYANKVLSMWRKLEKEGTIDPETRVILHLYSNNGAMFLSGLLQASPSFFNRVECIVWDSTPDLRRLTKRNASMSILDTLYSAHVFVTASCPPLCVIAFNTKTPSFWQRSLVHVAVWINLWVVSGYLNTWNLNCDTIEHNIPPNIRHLFIYSPCDEMVRSSSVVAFIRKLRTDAPVTELPLTDSSHVAHLLRHPDLYEEALEKFISSM